MKLYTEEQVLNIIQKCVMDKPETYYEVLKHYTPIELPSDVEVGKIVLGDSPIMEHRDSGYFAAGVNNKIVIMGTWGGLLEI